MKANEDKTNVMRILDQKKVPYIPHGYEHEEGTAVDAETVASLLGRRPEEIFKTLVTRGGKGGYYVFVIPGNGHLDLKKAAKAAGEKSIEMIKSAELLPLTGYIHGGCSPVGMKKLFPTFFDESALGLEKIIVSAGKIGKQIEVEPKLLMALIKGKTADLITEEQ